MGASFQNEYKWMHGFQPLQENVLKNSRVFYNCLRQQSASHTARRVTPRRQLIRVHVRCAACFRGLTRRGGSGRLWWKTSLADFDERLQHCVTALSLYLQSTKDLFQVAELLQRLFQQVFELCSVPKVQVQCSRSASCTPWVANDISLSIAIKNPRFMLNCALL